MERYVRLITKDGMSSPLTELIGSEFRPTIHTAPRNSLSAMAYEGCPSADMAIETRRYRLKKVEQAEILIYEEY